MKQFTVKNKNGSKFVVRALEMPEWNPLWGNQADCTIEEEDALPLIAAERAQEEAQLAQETKRKSLKDLKGKTKTKEQIDEILDLLLERL